MSVANSVSIPIIRERQISIALRKNVRTILEGSIYTVSKALKIIPPLPHPIFEWQSAMLNLIEVWGVFGQIPQLTSSLSHHLHP
jgi:hypothetical protein